MSWLAILLAAASLGGGATAASAPERPCAKHCTATKAKHKKPTKKQKKKATVTKPKPTAPSASDAPRADSSAQAPVATSTPTPAATPAPSATPAPVTYPTRTGVDLDEWAVRSSYRTLAAGRIDFNVTNVGEDDHNLAVRSGAHALGQLDLTPAADGTLTLALPAGTYVLYCSLTGHEEAGMRTEVTVR